MSGTNMVEISQAELAQLQRGYKLLSGLVGDKELGITVQKALKTADPSLSFPALDVGEPMLAPVREELAMTKTELQALKESLAADKQAAADDAARKKILSGVDEMAVKHRFTPEAKEKFKQFMVDNGIADASIAAPAFVETLPKPIKAPATPFLPQAANLFGADGRSTDQDIIDLHTSPTEWQDRKIAEIMNEDAQAA